MSNVSDKSFTYRSYPKLAYGSIYERSYGSAVCARKSVIKISLISLVQKFPPTDFYALIVVILRNFREALENFEKIHFRKMEIVRLNTIRGH